MKNFSLLFIAFLLLQLNTLAQDGWFEQTSGTTFTLNSVFFLNDSVGWAVGGEPDPYPGVGVVLKTTDGGETWTEQPTGLGYVWYDVCFVDLNTGFLAGRQFSGGPPVGGTVAKTTDGGMTWTALIGGLPPPQLNSVYFTDLSNGWTVGDNGVIKSTTDGGATWISQNSGTTQGLQSVLFTDANNGTAVGDAGTILRTTDGGLTWISQTSGDTNQLADVSFTDTDNGTVVGIRATILRTTNGGSTWISQTSASYQALNSVSFTDLDTGTIVDRHGIIQRTTDGGATWTLQSSGTTESLRGVWFTDSDNGTAVGDNGTILRTTNGGVSFVEEEQIDEIPTTYSLTNNFPNPFNPSTKIKYSVPQPSNIIIKVFDILGNEIETLVNEEKQTGTYEITWYAGNLPSGIYFYRLQAGDYIQTKKMVLMK